MEYMLARLRRNISTALEIFGRVDSNYFFTLKPRDSQPVLHHDKDVETAEGNVC
jgi:hypothetical protein